MRETATADPDRFLALLKPIERDLERYARRLIWEPQEAPDTIQNAGLDKLRERRCPLYDEVVTDNGYAGNQPVTIGRQVLAYENNICSQPGWIGCVGDWVIGAWQPSARFCKSMTMPERWLSRIKESLTV